jgi:hypothetical protein
MLDAMTSDFDFLHGSWEVLNRQRTAVLCGCDEWDEHQATATCRPVFGGAGNVDEIAFHEKGTSGLTLRLYDAESGNWSIYWASSRVGLTLPPVVGRFVDGVGVFYSDEVHQGRLVRLRFIWSQITPTSARWEQALSPDGGATWETNWVMELRRTGPPQGGL